jgi:hypothetical protein
MLTNGISCTEQRVALTRATETDIESWLPRREPPAAVKDLLRVAHHLNFRAYWLATGRGRALKFRALPEQEREAILLANRMDSKTLQTWLAIGRRLSD